MADEVEHLQTEIAAVEASMTDPEPIKELGPLAAVPARHAARPGAGWTPSPTPQPWLEARSA